MYKRTSRLDPRAFKSDPIGLQPLAYDVTQPPSSRCNHLHVMSHNSHPIAPQPLPVPHRFTPPDSNLAPPFLKLRSTHTHTHTPSGAATFPLHYHADAQRACLLHAAT
eukprot:366322-Chlamydomonas_euryale.AAC.10